MQIYRRDRISLESLCRLESFFDFILIYVGQREINFCSQVMCEANNKVIKSADAKVS